MKSAQLLSVVFSLIMFAGVSAGSVAFAGGDVDSEMREKLERYCEMSDEDKRDYLAENDKTEEHAEKMDRYCTLGDSDRADFVAEHRDEYKAHMTEKYQNKMTDMRKHMDEFCELSDEEKDRHIAEHEPTQEHIDRVMKYCSLDDEGRDAFVDEHRDEIKAHMKEKYHDKTHDKMHDKMSCPCHSGDDGTMQCSMMDEHSDMQCSMMDRKHDMEMNKMHDKMSDKSKRLQAMIMTKYDISDEQSDEIKMKYQEKYGDLSDEHKSELKMKFMKHMKFMEHDMTDERKAEIHDRVSEMRDFKAELRDRASELTDEEKQQLREEFIEKAKDLQLAWITPRTQIAAGIDAAEVECREGFTLVMKSSNGVPICLKADTALKMIDMGIVVPAA